jgi:hypothetical protein
MRDLYGIVGRSFTDNGKGLKQIPPLRCGMTTKKNCSGKDDKGQRQKRPQVLRLAALAQDDKFLFRLGMRNSISAQADNFYFGWG